jgi:tetratricopeptide (TPR) repeat protein
VPAAANAAWKKASTPHFVIYSQDSADSLRDFATRLERFDAAMRRFRDLPDPPLGPNGRLTIYAMPSVEAVQRVAGRRMKNLAGFYIPRASGSIAVVPTRTGRSGTYDLDAQSVLLHEYTHHFTMSEGAGIAYPPWLLEGLAEFYATTRFEKDGSVGFGLPAVHRAYGLMMLPIAAEKLLSSAANLQTGADAEAFYSRGWLLTHYLTFEPSRKGQLSAYLKAINNGEDGLAAARSVFGDLKKLDAELNKYKLRKRMAYYQFSPSELNIGTISISEVGPAEDALMDLRIRSDRGVNREEALDLVGRIRKAAAPYPQDPTAQTILAEAEYDAGNYDLAIAAADRAIAADPKRVDALLYKGRALMAKAVEGKAKEPATWNEVRRWFVAANKADTESAEPLWLHYQSFGAQGIAPPRNSVKGLMYAHVLAPQDRALRMTVARQHLFDGNLKDAQTTLAPIAYDPHAGQMGQLAATLMTALKAGGAKAALQAMEPGPQGSASASD